MSMVEVYEQEKLSAIEKASYSYIGSEENRFIRKEIVGLYNSFAFRGQASDWDVLPAIHRDCNVSKEEYEEISHFIERNSFFKKQPGLNILSYMQHEGKNATRLTDWTRNFHKALYFACASKEFAKSDGKIFYSIINDINRCTPLTSGCFSAGIIRYQEIFFVEICARMALATRLDEVIHIMLHSLEDYFFHVGYAGGVTEEKYQKIDERKIEEQIEHFINRYFIHETLKDKFRKFVKICPYQGIKSKVAVWGFLKTLFKIHFFDPPFQSHKNIDLQEGLFAIYPGKTIKNQPIIAINQFNEKFIVVKAQDKEKILKELDERYTINGFNLGVEHENCKA